MQERKKYTREEKRQHVARWQASGLTRQQYSDHHGIKFSTFRKWPQDTHRVTNNDDEALLPIHIAPGADATQTASEVNEPIMLFLPCGMRMCCHASQLTDVLRALNHAQA